MQELLRRLQPARPLGSAARRRSRSASSGSSIPRSPPSVTPSLATPSSPHSQPGSEVGEDSASAASCAANPGASPADCLGQLVVEAMASRPDLGLAVVPPESLSLPPEGLVCDRASGAADKEVPADDLCGGVGVLVATLAEGHAESDDDASSSAGERQPRDKRPRKARGRKRGKGRKKRRVASARAFGEIGDAWSLVPEGRC